LIPCQAVTQLFLEHLSGWLPLLSMTE